MDPDRLFLADPVEAADALLEQARIERQIEEHQVVGELEIAALAADFRADEQLRAVRLGKPRGVPVALNQRQPLVEKPHLHVHPFLQRRLDGGDLAPGFADEENLGRPMLGEERGQPVDPRILLERIAQARVGAGFLGMQFAGEARELGEIVLLERARGRISASETRSWRPGCCERPPGPSHAGRGGDCSSDPRARAAWARAARCTPRRAASR